MPFSEPSPSDAPSFADIEAAAARIEGLAVRTPLLESPLLNDRMGRRILVKPECLQKTGSFKFRGATNKIRALGDRLSKGGVVAYSSGNHAQGVAAAAKMAGIPALIVMPEDAPAIKRANTEAWGAEIKLYNRYTESREEIGEAIAEERGAELVRPFDDPLVIAGQGTVGLEIHQQLQDLDVDPESLLCCCGGGGLMAGVALAFKANRPDVPLYAVEPEDFDDTARSLESGSRETVPPEAKSICDAVLTPSPGIITFPMNQALLTGAVGVSDDEVRAAMRIAFQDLKIVAEPGGSVALAAALFDKVPGTGPVVAVVSGGNVDPAMFREALSA